MYLNKDFINIVLWKGRSLKSLKKKLVRIILNFLTYLLNFTYFFYFFSSFITVFLKKGSALTFKDYKYNLIFFLTRFQKSRIFSTRSILKNFFFNIKKTKGNFFLCIRPVKFFLKSLFRRKKILGYKLICTGRFSRRQRSQKKVYSNGPVPLSDLRQKIDFSFITIILKNSICGIKLYINKI
jgi:hypothetical protein